MLKKIWFLRKNKKTGQEKIWKDNEVSRGPYSRTEGLGRKLRCLAPPPGSPLTEHTCTLYANFIRVQRSYNNYACTGRGEPGYKAIGCSHHRQYMCIPEIVVCW